MLFVPTVDQCFDLLENVLTNNALKAGRIFNLDESGIPLQHPDRRTAVKEQKHVNVVSSGDKAHITILACVSASGYIYLPPPWSYTNTKTSLQSLFEERLKV